jgi:hypothetical protein
MVHLALALLSCTIRADEWDELPWDCENEIVQPYLTTSLEFETLSSIRLVNCRFDDLRGKSDGGVVACTTACNFFVEDSSMSHCSACGFGGVAYFSIVYHVFFSRCCISACFAMKLGNTLYIAWHSNVSLEVVGIHGCSPALGLDTCDGIHFSDHGAIATLSDINFTGNQALFVCVSAINGKSLSSNCWETNLSCRWMNVVGNSGVCGFYSARAMDAWVIERCNFYDNHLLVLGAFILSNFDGFGMRVKSCIFSGNDFDIGKIDTERQLPSRFILIDSVFSGPFPSMNLAITQNCNEQTRTASWTIASFQCAPDTELALNPYCPGRSRTPASTGESGGNPPTASANPSPIPSARQSPSRSLTDSPSPSLTDSPSPSLTDSPSASLKRLTVRSLRSPMYYVNLKNGQRR